MVDAWFDNESAREKEMWRRFAFLAAETINISGKVVKQRVKPDQLVSFDGDSRKRMTPAERDKRKREAAETLAVHKSKFWTKIKDETVAKITGA